MATANRNRTSRINQNYKSKNDFTQVGGLSNHIKLLREIIILPLLYGDLYTHFNIKAPRGVIFYGPPGTGKTLVAGALANELNKEGNGKVTFFQRKGADILDKWVGESERKLRDLFEKASRSRPSVIFFDELDGLAPERSLKNDQVHSSIVATLLALMDGLDNMAGVIIIGATNRIDSIDPALRRPGRFDRELFFPLPSYESRKEIIQVHTKSWKHKPSPEFLNRLSELTAGCCGSDLQALCAEAVLCSLKRKYPSINQKPKINIQVESLKVEEQDFLAARMNVTPTSQRLGNSKLRRLCPYIKPLLERQTDNILRHVHILLPHFTQIYRKFLVGNERYAGRLVLKGTIQQGLNAHIVPALLQTLEHLQSYVLDIPMQYRKIFTLAVHNLPSVLVLSRVDEWWNVMENSSQLSILSLLDNLHAGLPILLIATCSKDLPNSLQNHFYYNSSIVIEIDDPSTEEREQFFAPLFFGSNNISVYKIWQNEARTKIKDENKSHSPSPNRREKHMDENDCIDDGSTILKKSKSSSLRSSNNSKYDGKVHKRNKEPRGTNKKNLRNRNAPGNKEGYCDCKRKRSNHLNDDYGSTAVTDLVDCNNILHINKDRCTRDSGSNLKTIYVNSSIKEEPSSKFSLMLQQRGANNDVEFDPTDSNLVDIYSLWKRVSGITSDGLPVVQLELLYDTILACIYINKESFSGVIRGLESALNNFEHTCPKIDL